MLANVGSDVYLFVSGNNNSVLSGNRSKVTLFGGDVVVSGTFYAEKLVAEVDTTVNSDHHISGAIYLAEKGSAPSVGTDQVVLYSQDDGGISKLYFRNGTGITEIGAASGGTVTSGSFNEVAMGVEPKSFVSTSSLSLAGTRGINYSVANVGDDVFFFASGTIGSRGTSVRGTSVFGGDVHVSGSISLSGANSLISGSGASNRVAFWSGEETISSDSDFTFDGATLKVSSLVVNEPGGNNDFRVESLNKQNALLVDANTNQVLILSGGAPGSFDEAKASDVSFYVSGSVRSKTSSEVGTSVFGGDTMISGALYVGGGNWTSSTPNSSQIIDARNTQTKISFRNSGMEFVAGTGGSIHDGGEHNFLTINTIGQKSVMFNAFNEDIDFEVKSDTGTIIDTNAANHQMMLGTAVEPPNDTFMFVSGAIGGKNTVAGNDAFGTSVFGGDVVISGTLYDGSGNSIGAGGSIAAISGSTSLSSTSIEFTELYTFPVVP